MVYNVKFFQMKDYSKMNDIHLFPFSHRIIEKSDSIVAVVGYGDAKKASEYM